MKWLKDGFNNLFGFLFGWIGDYLPQPDYFFEEYQPETEEEAQDEK